MSTTRFVDCAKRIRSDDRESPVRSQLSKITRNCQGKYNAKKIQKLRAIKIKTGVECDAAHGGGVAER